MSFSMPSYFLGVGTVVGALALGFGGGIVLTKTAIKDSPAGPSRIERTARVEPAPQSQIIEAKAAPIPRVDQLTPQPPPAPAPVQAAVAEPVRQIEAPKQTEQPVSQADLKPMAQPARQDETRAVEQKEPDARGAERAQRRAEQRRIDREKRIAERERKAKTAIVVRRQRPVEEQEQPARPQLAFQREESGPGLFEGLFGRPAGERD